MQCLWNLVAALRASLVLLPDTDSYNCSSSEGPQWVLITALLVAINGSKSTHNFHTVLPNSSAAEQPTPPDRIPKPVERPPSRNTIHDQGFQNAEVLPRHSCPLLDAGKTPADFATVGLWCEKFNVKFGQAVLAASGSDGGSG